MKREIKMNKKDIWCWWTSKTTWTLKIQQLKRDSLCTKDNPNFSCPPILPHSDNNSLMEHSDSRQKLFDSCLNSVHVCQHWTSNGFFLWSKGRGTWFPSFLWRDEWWWISWNDECWWSHILNSIQRWGFL